MTDADDLLAAYDEQLRTDAEALGAVAVDRLGPLLLVTFPDRRGFVTYQPPSDDDLSSWVGPALSRFRNGTDVQGVEWKTRAHDRAPGLHEALLKHEFEPEEPESIMVGRASLLATEVPLPAGVALRSITAEADVRAMTAMQAVAFGKPASEGFIQGLLRRLGSDDGLEMWVAEAGGQVISAGRIELVPGTDFAGIWGGATVPAWRGRGIYRALTAARARAALAAGKAYINSDSTEYSRPILERSGLLKVSTTTPYQWAR